MTRRSILTALMGISLFAEPARIPANGELNQQLRQAVMAGDAGRVKALLARGADPNARDGSGTTVLMDAGVFADAAMMKLLVEHGADVNLRNDAGATALLWAAGDAAKARLLVEHGADVHAQSRLGRTPLMAAASVAGNAATVKLLLSRGARVNLKDEIEPIPVIAAGGGKGTALHEACRMGDLESVRALLDAGAEVNATDARNGTALSEAVMYGRRDVVKLLLARGADATGRVTALQIPYLSLAAARGDVEIARMLHRHGARVDVVDVAGNGPLLAAALSDSGRPEMTAFLIEVGADVNAKNKAGETALDWALRRGETAIVASLRQAGGRGSWKAAAPADRGEAATFHDSEAVSKALEALGKSAGAGKAACATCHNHALPMATARVAAHKGISSDFSMALKISLGMMTPMAAAVLEGSDAAPDLAVTGPYLLEALQAAGYRADRMTAAFVQKLAQSQMADGRWVGWAPRYPLEGGDIQATALVVRALRLYPLEGRRQEMDARIAKARRWLLAAKPVTTEDFIMRLEGLRESGAEASEVKRAAAQLAALQREGGGWAQLPGLAPDAYATGKAMVALSRAGWKAGDRKAGEDFLRRTQRADGSWHAASRSYPVQPMLDTGFPHGRDQWISAAATSWAAHALALGLP